MRKICTNEILKQSLSLGTPLSDKHHVHLGLLSIKFRGRLKEIRIAPKRQILRAADAGLYAK
jgi:hypothetical protein